MLSPVQNTRPLILVVEDEPDIRKLIQYNLAQERFRVLEAEDGEMVFRSIEGFEPPPVRRGGGR